MSWQIDESQDLKIFTEGEFGTIATVDSSTATTLELSGLFDTNYQDMFGSIDAPLVEGRNFCFKTQTSLLKGLRHGDRLEINGSNYQVVSLKPVHDGKLTNIVLKQDFS